MDVADRTHIQHIFSQHKIEVTITSLMEVLELPKFSPLPDLQYNSRDKILLVTS